MPEFIVNILHGIKHWVEKLLEEITYTLSLHVNSLTNRVNELENNHVVKQVRVDDICWLMTSGYTPLSAYGLSTDDVDNFINDKLTVNVNVGLLPTWISIINPEIVAETPEFIKK